MKLSDIVDLLFEGAREDFVVKQLGAQLEKRHEDELNKKAPADQIANLLSKADPSKNKQYLQWIARMYISKQFRLEDVVRLRGDLEEYERVKSKLQNKDINSFKNLGDLYNTLEPFKEQDVVSNKEQERRFEADLFKKRESEIFYNGATLKIIIPHTERASCYFGRGTKWCTAAKNENKFDHYNEEGPLYIIICKDGKKFQFHFGSEGNQFMDARDQEVNIEQLVKIYPELKDAFDSIAKEFLFLPLIKNQTPEICLAAVQKHGYALEYVKEQTPEICLAAVQKHSGALQFVKDLKIKQWVIDQIKRNR